MEWLQGILRAHPEIAFFLVLGLGYLFGKLSLGSFKLGAVTGTLLAVGPLATFAPRLAGAKRQTLGHHRLRGIGRGIGRGAGRADGRLVGRSTVDGRDGAIEGRVAPPAGTGRVEGIVVGNSPGNGVGCAPGRSGLSSGGRGGGTTTTGGYGS